MAPMTLYCCGEALEPMERPQIAGYSDLDFACFVCGRRVTVVLDGATVAALADGGSERGGEQIAKADGAVCLVERMCASGADGAAAGNEPGFLRAAFRAAERAAGEAGR